MTFILAAMHLNEVNAFQALGEYKKAINSYETAIHMDPNFSSAYFNLGVLFQELGEFKKAVSYYEKATHYAPDNLAYVHSLSVLKKEILDIDLKKAILNIMNHKDCTKRNLAYGNFLLAQYEQQDHNYKKEFDYLLKGHQFYFESRRNHYIYES